ncbi:MAG: hypothetical protein DWQ07_13965 [Chloroflexi bacterium]|nr:MAG: hypothetical protein DWQ07_13965 [Chloroflexota bacterium]
MNDTSRITVSEVDVEELPTLIWHHGMAGFYRQHLRKLTTKKALVFEYTSEEDYQVQRYSVIHAAKSMYGQGRVHTRRQSGTNKLYVWLRQPPDPEFVPDEEPA